MSTERREALVDILTRASRPLTGDELASRLGISSRTIRTYVRQLNEPEQIIEATRAGYVLRPDAQRRLTRRAPPRSTIDTPDKRLTYLCRSLAQSSDALSVHDLAATLFVSESTIEADLGRAREMLRQFDMKITRSRDLVKLVGPERGRRRLVRQLVYGSAKGLVPATWNALVKEFKDIDVAALRGAVQEILDASDLSLHEFALSDVVLHLTVTVDRVRHGHVLPSTDLPPGERDPELVSTVHRLADAVTDLCRIELPATELDAIYSVLVVRGVVGAHTGDVEAGVDAETLSLVADMLEQMAAKYFLTAATPKAALNLALHVQGLLARARSGTPLPHPLGDGFKNSHPLLHDLALDFASGIEERTGLRVVPGELDYLALHMGMQYMSSFEQRDLVTVTLVAPRFYDMGSTLADQLRHTLKGLGIIETVAHTLDFDFRSALSDVIVSTVPPDGPASAPVITIHPLPTREDLDRVTHAVRSERERTIRRRIRSTLSTLIDPALFVHREASITQEEALSLLADRLVTAGYTEEHFLTDVLDRESRSSTAFGGDFAIPHSMRMDAHATAIAPLVCDEGIPWGNSRVRLVLLFALSPDGRQTFRDVLDEVTRLLSQGQHVAELIGAGSDPHRFMATFMDLLDRTSTHH